MLHVVMADADAATINAAIAAGPEEALMRVAIAGAGAVGRSIAARAAGATATRSC